MLITKRSVWSHVVHTIDIPITEAQVALWQGGTVIQKAAPHLTAWQREFLITGMTEAEWTEMEQQQAAIDKGEA